jgi:hypothetical protein
LPNPLAASSDVPIDSNAASITDVSPSIRPAASGTPTVVSGEDPTMMVKPMDALENIPPAKPAMKADGTQAFPYVVAIDGSGSHSLIQAAIDSSRAGDVITIKPGAYSEALRIPHSLVLMGLGEPEQCVIANSEAPPIEVIDALANVRLANLSIRGNAVQSGKEFNAIELTHGSLKLERCHVRSSTWNSIKAKAGSSLEAVECTFFESNDFSVSGLEHRSMIFTDCDFTQSGVQSVGGPISVTKCRFLGVEGVYVRESRATVAHVSDCDFTNCFEYGVAAIDDARIIVENSRFNRCKFGVKAANSRAIVSDCEITDSGSSAINLVGGTMQVSNGCAINRSKKFGCMVEGGNIQFTDVKFLDIADAAIVADKDNYVSIENGAFSKCGSCAVDMMSGTLVLRGSIIEGCEQTGLFFSEKFQRAAIGNTKFVGNPGGAMLIQAGDFECRNVSISGSETGILIRPDADRTVSITLKDIRFADMGDFPIDIEGKVEMNVYRPDFGGLPKERQIQALGKNARVTLHL